MYEYDCQQERYGFLTLTYHSEGMAGGRQLPGDEISMSINSNGGSWSYLPEGAVERILLPIACAK